MRSENYNRNSQRTPGFMESAFSTFHRSDGGHYPKLENNHHNLAFSNRLFNPHLRSALTDSHYTLPTRTFMPTNLGYNSLSMLLGSLGSNACAPPYSSHQPAFHHINPPTVSTIPNRSFAPDQRTHMPSLPCTPHRPAAVCAQPLLSKVFPRRRVGQKPALERKAPVVLSQPIIAQYFGMPLAEAAARLGICSTALKSACRCPSHAQTIIMQTDGNSSESEMRKKLEHTEPARVH
jgi:hypothetical protein